ncbi:MAG: hypothetical protein CMP47_15235 [Rickettsiales bacterium]|jgi:hypothetical protein|nr:hypothetical protein [Rickettsiales bacterium]
MNKKYIFALSILVFFIYLLTIVISFETADSSNTEMPKIEKSLAQISEGKKPQIDSKKTEIQSEKLYNNVLSEQRTNLEKYYASDDLYSLFMNLHAKSDLNADDKLVLFKILEFCNPDNKFNYNLNPSDPDAMQSLMSWAVNRCSGFNQQSYDYYKKEQGNDFIFELAEQGSAFAKVEAVTRAKKSEKLNKDKALSYVQEILKSQDAYAIRHMKWLDKSYSPQVWTLLSCKLGAECKPITFAEKLSIIYGRCFQKAECDISGDYREMYSEDIKNKTNVLYDLLYNENKTIEDLGINLKF